jgi:cysteinyl-tRNA synthetase
VLLDQVRSSWVSYYRSQLSKGFPDEQKPVDGQEERAWEGILALADNDNAWKSACIARDEKFGMHLMSLVRIICRAPPTTERACGSGRL